VVALVSILVLMAGGFGYLLVNFRAIATQSAQAIAASSERYSLLLDTYQATIDAYNVAAEAYTHPETSRDFRTTFFAKSARVREGRAQYLKLADGLDPGVHVAKAIAFFDLADTLSSQMSAVFTTTPASSRKPVFPGTVRRLFTSAVMEDFRQLRKEMEGLTELEMRAGAAAIHRGRDETQDAALKWFTVSCIVFVFAVILAAFVVMMERKATTLIQQVRTVMDQFMNPLVVTNRSGTISYANGEMEKWSGTPKEFVLGANFFDAVRTHNGGPGAVPVRDEIFRSIAGGETWYGEVDMHHPTGTVSTSTLLVLPIVDGSGRVQELVNILHDTTERKNLARKVEEVRIQYQNLVENSLDGIVVIQGGNLVFVNPAARRIFGFNSREEMEGLKFLDAVAPASRPFLILDESTHAVGDEILKNYEMKGLTKDGKLIDLEINARVIVWSERPALQASFRDISERKSMEREQAVWLWEQETLSSIDRQLLGIVDLQRVLDIILQQVLLLTRAHFSGIILFDRETRHGHWRAIRGNRTPALGEFFLMSPALSSFLRAKDHVTVESWDESSVPLKDMPPLESEGIASAAFFPLTVNHELRGRLVVGYRQRHGFPDREMRVVSSMAEKISIALTSGEMYEDLLHREKELEHLSGARVQAQEEERRRISREIHDGLGQLLTAIKFNLEIFEDTLPENGETIRRIADMKQLLDNVMKEAREISYNLMPSVLDDFGLVPGLISLCEQFSKGTGMKVAFHEHGLKERLGPDQEIGLYRIVQEALNNIVKHADAREVEVQIVRHADVLRMTVEDDGKGMEVFSPAERSLEHGGTGLVSMRERAGSMKGTLMIDSTPGKGTTISVEIPLSSG